MLAEKLRAATAAAAADPSWNLANAVYQGTPLNYFYVGTQETSPGGVFFKPDGLKMYIVGFSGDDVNEYNLSTAWDVSTASYLQNFYVGAQEASPLSVFFKPDGLKMYMVGVLSDNVNEYDLSTAWDVSTASYSQSFSVAVQETSPAGVSFKPDGLKMYVIGYSGDDVNEYNLSTAWDVSTASYLQNFSVAAQEPNPYDVFFKPDGLKMYVIGFSNDRVNEYNLSTAWDISTASYSQNFYVGAKEVTPRSVFFKPDGLKMYVVGSTSDSIWSYDLSTAWDVSTASFTDPTTEKYSVTAQETNPQGLFFKPDGLKMYVIGTVGDDVNEYDLSTAWDITTASYSQNFYVGTQEAAPMGLFFKPDGLKMYVVGFATDMVLNYDLSTAWDVSTASYSQSFYVGAQDGSPQGLFFKPDGLKMYVVGYASDNVNEYNLSTAWDITTASYSQSFSVAVQESTPHEVSFKPDGLKMYVIGSSGDDVNEYNLSTAWDISTASYSQNFFVGTQDGTPQGLFFKPDGLKMYVIGDSSDSIWSYDFV